MLRPTENSDWTLPGGPMRDDETLQQAMSREVRERTGLLVEVGPLFDVYKETDSSINYLFICKEIGGVLTINNRASEFGAFGLEEIPANIDPSIRQHLFSYWRNPNPRQNDWPELIQEPAEVLSEPVKSQTASVAVATEVSPLASFADEAATAPSRSKLVKPQIAPPPDKKGRSGWWVVGPGLVTILALLLFSITRRGYFLADDFVVLNQLNFKQISFVDNLVWFGRDWGVGVDFYRPWVRLAYYFQYAVFGNNPAGWHLFSTGLHTANSLLVFTLAGLLTRRAGVATIAGLVFALQPIHSEPVNWISGQTDLWATFFALACVCAYIRTRQLQKQKRPHLLIFVVALLSFVMALFSKEIASAIPVALLTYDFVRGGLDRLLNHHNEIDEGRGNGLISLVLYQMPFWILLAGYFVLRLALFQGIGGYSSSGASLDIGQFLRVYLRWLTFPFGLGGTDGLILLLVVASFLALAGVQEWERFRLVHGEQIADEANQRELPPYWNLRTAGYGAAWAVIFLLPTLLTPAAERFTYLPSVGFALFVAVCLTPFGPYLATTHRKRQLFKPGRYFEIGTILRLGALAAVLITYFATSSQRANSWNEAGFTAKALLDKTKEVIPGIVKYSVFVSEGVPESGNGTLIFRTGYPEAIQLLYKDATLESQKVDRFPIIEGKLDRTIFLQYKGDRLINHTEINKTLLARNDNLKKEKSFVFWEFKNAVPNGLANDPRGSWTEVSGAGSVEIKDGTLNLNAAGAAEIQSPFINIPAAQLGTIEITLKASPRSGEPGGIRSSATWEPVSNGEPRDYPAIPIEIKADGKFYTYKITPPIPQNYNYSDTIAYFRLKIPAELQEVVIQSVRQNSLPIEYTPLSE